ncbi:MAG: hypothetical protein KJ645_13970, partial [Planctomycetes bacterium]|nr:hypothetical protein [Planctomycetota bacterium]
MSSKDSVCPIAMQDRDAELGPEGKKLLAMMEGLDDVIYVSDPETYELLYVNNAFRKNWGDGIGRKCYEVLQNWDAPCPFCTNERIMGEHLGKPYIWEFKNTVNQRWYR